MKLLQYVNAADPHDEAGLLRLYDFFYFKVGAAWCPLHIRCHPGHALLAPVWYLLRLVVFQRLRFHFCTVCPSAPRALCTLTSLRCWAPLQEHLVLVTELLRANLYEFQKYNRESGDEPYFTLPRIQSIARQARGEAIFVISKSKRTRPLVGAD